jgi:hypothetical protein
MMAHSCEYDNDYRNQRWLKDEARAAMLDQDGAIGVKHV